MSVAPTLERHFAPKDFSDRVAYGFTRLLRFFADTFFARRYGHRAVVLETVAAVPGMVGGALQHLRALRRMESDHGRIRTLLDEAEPVEVHVGKYRLEQRGEDASLTVLDATTSRQWLTGALREFVVGRSFTVPAKAAAALKLLT